MDDMNVFERLVAEKMLRRAGPEPVVDDVAIFTAIAAAQSRTWRFQAMFDATRFIVATAIVTLFGGFLLAGVLTMQPSDEQLPAVGASASPTAEVGPTPAASDEPTPTPGPDAEQTEVTIRSDILPGVDLVTEEVEPGVFRVVSDGYRDPSRTADDEDRYLGGSLDGNIVAGLDGSVWWFGLDGRRSAHSTSNLGRSISRSDPTAPSGSSMGRAWALGRTVASRPTTASPGRPGGRVPLTTGPISTAWRCNRMAPSGRHGSRSSRRTPTAGTARP